MANNNFVLWELQNITKELTKIKDEHKLNFRPITNERFQFIDTIINTSKLGLVRLSVHNLVFNIIETSNQFLYAS